MTVREFVYVIVWGRSSWGEHLFRMIWVVGEGRISADLCDDLREFFREVVAIGGCVRLRCVHFCRA